MVEAWFEKNALKELQVWQTQMLKRPGLFNGMAKRLQTRINNLIPEKVHQAITTVIKQMIRGVLFGAESTSTPALTEKSLAEREQIAEGKIDFYRKTAAVEGGITGAGGILLGLADFPILMGIKIKLLFELAGVYGHEVKNYKERLYILHIFQLAFCSDEQRKDCYLQMQNWDSVARNLPADINDFDWRTFQQEYRDYIDLAKMAQLIPVIGAPVGVIVNNRLLRKLGKTARMAYRMRYFDQLRNLPDSSLLKRY
ncbi:MAG: EcsC family protein [Chitinophagaceae bacterium]|nr:MAG: EcsC family protein [Chitinophagaceae bacterium]